MIIKNSEDISNLKEIGKIVANCLNHLEPYIKPGITTLELDNIAGDFLIKHGAISAPVYCYKFPGHTCISINEEVAHGIPSDRVLKEGDLVNIDVSAMKNDYFADTGFSFPVGKISQQQELVLKATKLALNKAIKVARAGMHINLIGKVVEEIAKEYGLNIIKDLYSHGVGRALHEEPKSIPTYYDIADQRILTKGMVITIEPFLTTGDESIETKSDGWTLINCKDSITAQFEHSMIITDDLPIILTNR